MIHSDFFIFNWCSLLMNKWKKMKNKKYHNVGTTPESSTHIHDCSLSLLSTGASINSVFNLLVKCQPSHIPGEQRYYIKKKTTKNPIILNIITLYTIYLILVSQKLSYNSSSIKQIRWDWIKKKIPLSAFP